MALWSGVSSLQNQENMNFLCLSYPVWHFVMAALANWYSHALVTWNMQCRLFCGFWWVLADTQPDTVIQHLSEREESQLLSPFPYLQFWSLYPHHQQGRLMWQRVRNANALLAPIVGLPLPSLSLTSLSMFPTGSIQVWFEKHCMVCEPFYSMASLLASLESICRPWDTFPSWKISPCLSSFLIILCLYPFGSAFCSFFLGAINPVVPVCSFYPVAT